MVACLYMCLSSAFLLLLFFFSFSFSFSFSILSIGRLVYFLAPTRDRFFSQDAHTSSLGAYSCLACTLFLLARLTCSLIRPLACPLGRLIVGRPGGGACKLARSARFLISQPGAPFLRAPPKGGTQKPGEGERETKGHLWARRAYTSENQEVALHSRAPQRPAGRPTNWLACS